MRIITTIFICFNFIIASCAGEQKQSPAPQCPSFGYGIYEDAEKRPITAGAMDNIAIWEAYIEAHNAKDLTAIDALNAEEFKAFGPRGEIIDGKEAHMAFLTEWFAANSPTWKSNWYMTNAIADAEGKLRQWVTSSHNIQLTVEGNTVEAIQIHDALIVEGKVNMFFVYERAKADMEETPAE